ncbi:MAG: PQQ-binding-like beta-propeller repeat protein [Candidatus Eremiobacterota bacterium]
MLWTTRSGKHHGLSIGACRFGLLVCLCDEEPVDVWYRLVDVEVRLLDAATGQVLWARKDCGLLGMRDNVALVRSGDRLLALALESGAPLWEMPFSPDQTLDVGRDLYLRPDPSLETRVHPLTRLAWQDSRRPPGLPRPVEVPEGRLAEVREVDGLLAVRVWWPEPGVHGRSVLCHQGRRVWEQADPEHVSRDLLVDRHGLVVRTAEELQALDREGCLLWSAPGGRRCFVSPRWIACEGAELSVVGRMNGRRRELPGLTPVWDVAVAGDTLWVVRRKENRLVGLSADGTVLWEGPQPGRPDPYGYDRLIAYRGGLYGMGDDGTVARLV